MQILSDQPDDLLVGLVQLHTAAAGVFPIVLAVDDATAAAVIVDNEAVVFGVVSVRGGAAARWILITDADAVIATAAKLGLTVENATVLKGQLVRINIPDNHSGVFAARR